MSSQKKLNKQSNIVLGFSITHFVLGTLGSFLYAPLITIWVKGTEPEENVVGFSPIISVLIAFASIFLIARFVIWILGIIASVKLNTLSKNKFTYLIVFSILTLWIAFLISAIIVKSKIRSTYNATTSYRQEKIDNVESKLKLLKEMKDKKMITDAEFKAKKQDLLKSKKENFKKK